MDDDETDICGAETTQGHPCQNAAESCPWHNTDNPPDNGRDSKLTKEREEEIAQALENGRSMTSAARMAGVSRNAVYSWIEKGEDQEEGIYADFHDRIRRARGYGEEWYFSLAMELAKENGDHRFIASLMKQRYPNAWGDAETGVEADTVTLEVSERVSQTWPDE
jgi:transposase